MADALAQPAAAGPGGPGPAAGAARPLPLGSGRSPGRGRRHRAGGGCFSKPAQPSALQARILAALADLPACCSASPTRRCRWRRRPSTGASRSAPSPSTRMAWRHSASSRPSAASWRPGWRRCTPPSRSPAGRQYRGRGPRRGQPHVPALHGRPFHRGARGSAQRAARPPAPWTPRPRLTSVLDNNTAAVLTATGRWAEADQLLAELIGESRANVTRYLQLLQLELAVGRGERDSAEELATALRKSPEDPRLHRAAACLPRRTGAERG